MRQKYIISQEGTQHDFKIREYAIIDKNLKNVASSMLRQEDFEFLCEETYSHARIERSISQGKEAVVDTLRTPNMFPIRPYVVKMAESVMVLFDSADDGSVELFFDDTDLVASH
ncbi:MAG: hypothetical protein PVJ53_16510 [Desulfobacterales bacterium]|jgi:hypothetical protein